MSDTIRCPDCGHENPPGLTECAACGFPLDPEAAARVSGGRTEVPSIPLATAGEPPPAPYIPRPIRRPPRPRANAQAATLWLFFGTFCALVVIGVAVKTNVDRATQPVEGSSPVQQASADSVMAELQRDSTNVAARVRLGDIFYDTANWPQAIVQYRAAIRMDSSLTASLVDLGVCYYNLGAGKEAERHFLLALQRDPHQPVALFNLGVVYEGRKDYRRALELFHRALQTQPPDEMKQAVIAAMERIQQEQGLKAGPLRP
jgi:tetratricopeptide (TPR) repeat protein